MGVFFLSLNYKAIRFVKCWQSRKKNILHKSSSLLPHFASELSKICGKEDEEGNFFLFSLSFGRSTARVLQFSPEQMLHWPSFPVSAQPAMHPSFPAIPDVMDPHNVVPNHSCACWWLHLQTEDTQMFWIFFFFPSLWKSFLLGAIWQEIHNVICNRKIMD